MKKAMILFVAVLAAGCTPFHETNHQRCTIVATAAAHNVVGDGKSPIWTVVQLENGVRLRRQGLWGKVGDTFICRPDGTQPSSYWAGKGTLPKEETVRILQRIQAPPPQSGN